MLPERHQKEVVVHFGSKQQENYFLNSLIDFINALYISIISLSLEEVAKYEVALPPSVILARTAKPGQLSLVSSYVPVCIHFCSLMF